MPELLIRTERKKELEAAVLRRRRGCFGWLAGVAVTAERSAP